MSIFLPVKLRVLPFAGDGPGGSAARASGARFCPAIQGASLNERQSPFVYYFRFIILRRKSQKEKGFRKRNNTLKPSARSREQKLFPGETTVGRRILPLGVAFIVIGFFLGYFLNQQ
ncbi:MAG: hypothetical protein AB1330_05010 [Bacillota bacterium]